MGILCRRLKPRYPYKSKEWFSLIQCKECNIKLGDSIFSLHSRQLASKRNKAKALDSYLHDYAFPPPPNSFPPYVEKDFFNFEIFHRSKKPGSRARVGRITTPHGIIDTPGFVAVGTNGAIKAVDGHSANKTGQQLMFCNTYHLLLQPGPDVIQAAGGLHEFINRKDRPIITDSGGFQVFSLAYGSVHDELNMKSRARKIKTDQDGKKILDHSRNKPSVLQINETGVVFRSYRDGKEILLTPESTVQAQKAYGSDIIIPLDELHPYHIDDDELRKCVTRSHRWEARSLREHLRDIKQQAMYAVIHGGSSPSLRAQSVKYLSSLPFDGYAIGGSLGKDREELYKILSFTMPNFPENDEKPIHLLGIADDKSLERASSYGLDTFDSCFPTRVARHGTIMTFQKGEENIQIRKTKFKNDLKPLEQDCPCDTCKNHSRAYLHHLYKANEPVVSQLLTVHNMTYMNRLMKRIRERILLNEI